MGNSPETGPHRVLGSLTEAEIQRFLTECVNLPNPIDIPEQRPHFERWVKRWGKLFTFRVEAERTWKTIQVPLEHLESFAPFVRTTLSRLWAEPDSRQRDWYCYRLRDGHRQMVRHLEGWDERPIWGGPGTVARLTDYALQEVPAVCPFEAAVYWLQHHQDLTLRCGGPTCAAPLFFRVERRQKFCSPECADPARREAKLKWWNESPNSPKNKGLEKIESHL